MLTKQEQISVNTVYIHINFLAKLYFEPTDIFVLLF